MIKSSKPKVQVTKQPHQAAILLLITMADTTWRIFVPTLLGMVIGMWLDGLMRTKAIFTVILLIAGFAAGIGLVLRQLKRINDAK